MTDHNETRPTVRRGVRRWSIVAFVVLIPLAVHALWDAVEVRAAKAAIDAVASTGAPVNTEQLMPPGTVEPSVDAAPYYTAAAALVRESASTRYNELVESLRTSTDLAPLLPKVRDELAGQADALRLLDRATTLEFKRFAPGMDYSYRGSQLWKLANLTMLRTMYAGLTGDAAGAASSLVTELGLFGSSRSPIPMDWFHWSRTVPDRLQLMLSTSAIPDASLARLASALARDDEDGRLTTEILNERARNIETFVSRARTNYSAPGLASAFWKGGAGVEGTLARPLYARWIQRELRTLAELLEASRRPWPERLDKIRAVPVPGGNHAPPYAGISAESPSVYYLQRAVIDGPIGGLVTDLAAIRAARVAVAIERYRAKHGGALPDLLDQLVPEDIAVIPADPFSGQPLVYRRVDAGYTVYSIGDDRKDDGGDFEDTRIRDPKTAQPTGHPSKDIGLKVVRKGR